MNKLKLNLGEEYDPTLNIYIDGINFFTISELRKDRYKPVDLRSFLFNEWEHRGLKFLDNPRKRPRKNDVFNGIMVIGICGCGCEGCGDISVWINTNKKTTTWKTCGKEFIFDAIEYKNEIQKLTDNYYSYSWESEEHKINRICVEYIKNLKSKNAENIKNNTFSINTRNCG